MSLLAALAPRPRALSASASRLVAPGVTSLSKSQIGEVVRDLDAHVDAFRTRPLGAGPHTFAAADALVLQALHRDSGRKGIAATNAGERWAKTVAVDHDFVSR